MLATTDAGVSLAGKSISRSNAPGALHTGQRFVGGAGERFGRVVADQVAVGQQVRVDLRAVDVLARAQPGQDVHAAHQVVEQLPHRPLGARCRRVEAARRYAADALAGVLQALFQLREQIHGSSLLSRPGSAIG